MFRFGLPLLLLVAFSLAGCGERGTLDAARGDAERGRLLVARYHCGHCHAVPGVPAARGLAGPDLASYARRSYIAGRWPNEPARLASWIAEPQALAPDTPMPNLGVSATDARDIVAYLATLR
ncbi:c-type cytochrome [Pseudaquabacterium terrae]|uniref:c-type cytochrome n=1 Tax=Pseudaquabacterium terrae TaxID=2732868 RepID=UPI0031B59139